MGQYSSKRTRIFSRNSFFFFSWLDDDMDLSDVRNICKVETQRPTPRLTTCKWLKTWGSRIKSDVFKHKPWSASSWVIGSLEMLGDTFLHNNLCLSTAAAQPSGKLPAISQAPLCSLLGHLSYSPWDGSLCRLTGKIILQMSITFQPL